MNHIILTGHSRGLGAGIAEALLSEKNWVYGISRTVNDGLNKLALNKGFSINSYKCNLSDLNSIRTIFRKIAVLIKPDQTTGLYLINNAGVVTPVGPLPTLDMAEYKNHININFLAPVYLTYEFISLFQSIPVTKRILNISSGAAINPYYGWSAYCSGKAGLEIFARCVAAEQETQQHPIHIMSVAPGVIDTDMQATIRQTTELQFRHREKFVELKNENKLMPPSIAGRKIVKLLFSKQFKNGGRIDLRQKLKN